MNFKQITKLRNISRCLVGMVIGLGAIAIQAPSAHSAEQVKLIYGPFSGKVSVKSLEKFAKTGEMTREFRMYSRFVDRQTLEEMGYWLNSRFECDRVTMYRFTKTAEGEKFFQDLGTVIKTHPQKNGFLAIRSALLETADAPAESDGWTILEAMYNFPSEDLQINTRDLFKLQKTWSANPQQNQAAMEIFAVKEETSPNSSCFSRIQEIKCHSH